MGLRWSFALATLVTLASCFTGKSSGSAAAPPSNQDPGAARRRAIATAIADPLGFMPIDSDVVLQVDVGRVRQSAIWRDHEDLIARGAGPTLTQVREACKFDPLAQIHTIRIALDDDGASRSSGVVTISGSELDRMFACLPQTVKSPATIELHGNVVVGTTTEGTPYVATLIDRSTVVAVHGPAASRDRLEAVVTSGVPLRRSPAFSEMFALVNTQSAMWFVMNGSSVAAEAVRKNGLEFRTMFGWLGLVDGLSASVRIRVDTPDAATKLAATFLSQTAMVKGFATRLDISSAANDVVLELGMTDAQVNSVLGLLGGFLGGPPPPSTAPVLLVPVP